jgi:crotonobetainyl-CoA:carnitine CoA-transferase CaiB-like acyl-CoA transferase
VTLDLSTDEGRALALELAADADLLFENFRPGTMGRWGLDYRTLRETDEELILVRISGYGQTGPRAEQPGFGTAAQAISGFAHRNGYPDRDPLLAPISLADLTAAQAAVQSAMFAVYERDVAGSGEGQVIDVSLYESLFRLFVGDVEKYDAHGTVTERSGSHHPNAAPRNVYEAGDGYVALSASAQSIFENLAETIGHPELVEDPRFADDHYRAREDVVEVDDPDVGPTATRAVLPKFSRTPGEVDHLGPGHGEHTEVVFVDELGLEEATLAELRAEGIV